MLADLRKLLLRTSPDDPNSSGKRRPRKKLSRTKYGRYGRARMWRSLASKSKPSNKHCKQVDETEEEVEEVYREPSAAEKLREKLLAELYEESMAQASFASKGEALFHASGSPDIDTRPPSPPPEPPLEPPPVRFEASDWEGRNRIDICGQAELEDAELLHLLRVLGLGSVEAEAIKDGLRKQKQPSRVPGRQQVLSSELTLASATAAARAGAWLRAFEELSGVLEEGTDTPWPGPRAAAQADPPPQVEVTWTPSSPAPLKRPTPPTSKVSTARSSGPSPRPEMEPPAGMVLWPSPPKCPDGEPPWKDDAAALVAEWAKASGTNGRRSGLSAFLCSKRTPSKPSNGKKGDMEAASAKASQLPFEMPLLMQEGAAASSPASSCAATGGLRWPGTHGNADHYGVLGPPSKHLLGKKPRRAWSEARRRAEPPETPLAPPSPAAAAAARRRKQAGPWRSQDQIPPPPPRPVIH